MLIQVCLVKTAKKYTDMKLKQNTFYVNVYWTSKTHKSSDCSFTCVSYVCLPKECAKAHQVSVPAKLGSEGG